MYTQADALKAKDMTKSLVTGEFEKEYTSPPKNRCTIVLAIAIGVLAVCLGVLTAVREIQIARLRNEVDQLTANMIAMTVNMKSINQKLSTRRVNIMDDINYDLDVTGTKEELDKTMVLENDDVVDEDMYADDDDDDDDEDDDEESGYWYADYDKRREKTGTTNMVHLKPEDFTGSVVTRGRERPPSNIRELHRMLNAASGALRPEDHTEPPLTDAGRGKRSVFPGAGADVVIRPDESLRRKTKKFLPDGSKTLNLQHTVSRTVRNSDEARRPFVAAHFHGNTSHLNPEIHEHFKGNGLIRVAHDAAHNVWYPSAWTAASPHPRPTLTRNGHVHVHHTGVYLVYVQIYYLDSHDIISWVLHRTNSDVEGRETLLQCAQSSHSTERLDKPNSCFSAAALFLKAGDRLAVRNTGGDRHSLMEPEKSFIGLIKLADAEDPEQEF